MYHNIAKAMKLNSYFKKGDLLMVLFSMNKTMHMSIQFSNFSMLKMSNCINTCFCKIISVIGLSTHHVLITHSKVSPSTQYRLGLIIRLHVWWFHLSRTVNLKLFWISSTSHKPFSFPILPDCEKVRREISLSMEWLDVKQKKNKRVLHLPWHIMTSNS